MADPVVAELNERFASGDRELEPDVVAELRSIMRLYDLSPEDLFFKFESYSMKMELEGVNPSIQVLRAFKQDIQSSLERSHRAQAHVKSEKRAGATPRSTAKGADVFSVLEGLVPTTPGTGKLGKMSSARKRQLETPSISRVKSEHPGSSPDNKSPSRLDDANGAVSSFHDRPNPGEVIEVLNEEIPVPDPPVAPFTEPRIRIATASDQKPLGYKTMAMKISEVANVLDERIEEFTALVKEHRHLDDAQCRGRRGTATAYR
ncbi:hypothetical protein VTK73DRAFT_2044 [Phialemonium thermophilum]|uniref:Uncharacterized protein n=1 Tax=Phialemonium thermophilum TaxID=223376 RepID=A0ABR3VSN4_9PEZI